MSHSGLAYLTYDVFTGSAFRGNPLAIIKVPADRQLSQEQKQTIAKEFNYSESVFLHVPNVETVTQREWEIDIFTTTEELPFAGHPTVGTAKALADIYPDMSNGALITKAGRIPFEIERKAGTARARLGIPHNVHVHGSRFSREDVAKLQPALADYLGHLDPTGSAVVSVVKGMTFVLIQLDSLETLSKVKLSPIHLNPLVQLDEGWTPSFVAPYFYVVDQDRSKGNTKVISCRMIEADVGEDPATGSAASTLGAFLAIEQYGTKDLSDETGNTFDLELEQGVQMGRKSDISVRVVMKGAGEIGEIMLSGEAVKVMAGTFA